MYKMDASVGNSLAPDARVVDNKDLPCKREKQVQSKKELILYHLDKDYSFAHSRNFAQDLKSYIGVTARSVRESPRFLKKLRSKILSLHYYNSTVSKAFIKYPAGESLRKLLIRYVELNVDVASRSRSECYKQDVEAHLLRFLAMIYSNFCDNYDKIPRSKKYKETWRLVYKVLTGVKADLRPNVKQMADTVLRKLNLLDEVKALKDTLVCPKTNLRLINIKEELHTNGYCTDSEAENSESDSSDVELPVNFERLGVPRPPKTQRSHIKSRKKSNSIIFSDEKIKSNDEYEKFLQKNLEDEPLCITYSSQITVDLYRERVKNDGKPTSATQNSLGVIDLTCSESPDSLELAGDEGIPKQNTSQENVGFLDSILLEKPQSSHTPPKQYLTVIKEASCLNQTSRKDTVDTTVSLQKLTSFIWDEQEVIDISDETADDLHLSQHRPKEKKKHFPPLMSDDFICIDSDSDDDKIATSNEGDTFKLEIDDSFENDFDDNGNNFKKRGKNYTENTFGLRESRSTIDFPNNQSSGNNVFQGSSSFLRAGDTIDIALDSDDDVEIKVDSVVFETDLFQAIKDDNNKVVEFSRNYDAITHEYFKELFVDKQQCCTNSTELLDTIVNELQSILQSTSGTSSDHNQQIKKCIEKAKEAKALSNKEDNLLKIDTILADFADKIEENEAIVIIDNHNKSSILNNEPNTENDLPKPITGVTDSDTQLSTCDLEEVSSSRSHNVNKTSDEVQECDHEENIVQQDVVCQEHTQECDHEENIVQQDVVCQEHTQECDHEENIVQQDVVCQEHTQISDNLNADTEKLKNTCLEESENSHQNEEESDNLDTKPQENNKADEIFSESLVQKHAEGESSIADLQEQNQTSDDSEHSVQEIVYSRKDSIENWKSDAKECLQEDVVELNTVNDSVNNLGMDVQKDTERQISTQESNRSKNFSQKSIDSQNDFQSSDGSNVNLAEQNLMQKDIGLQELNQSPHENLVKELNQRSDCEKNIVNQDVFSQDNKEPNQSRNKESENSHQNDEATDKLDSKSQENNQAHEVLPESLVQKHLYVSELQGQNQTSGDSVNLGQEILYSQDDSIENQKSDSIECIEEHVVEVNTVKSSVNNLEKYVQRDTQFQISTQNSGYLENFSQKSMDSKNDFQISHSSNINIEKPNLVEKDIDSQEVSESPDENLVQELNHTSDYKENLLHQDVFSQDHTQICDNLDEENEEPNKSCLEVSKNTHQNDEATDKLDFKSQENNKAHVVSSESLVQKHGDAENSVTKLQVQNQTSDDAKSLVQESVYSQNDSIENQKSDSKECIAEYVEHTQICDNLVQENEEHNKSCLEESESSSQNDEANDNLNTKRVENNQPHEVSSENQKSDAKECIEKDVVELNTVNVRNLGKDVQKDTEFQIGTQDSGYSENFSQKSVDSQKDFQSSDSSNINLERENLVQKDINSQELSQYPDKNLVEENIVQQDVVSEICDNLNVDNEEPNKPCFEELENSRQNDEATDNLDYQAYEVSSKTLLQNNAEAENSVTELQVQNQTFVDSENIVHEIVYSQNDVEYQEIVNEEVVESQENIEDSNKSENLFEKDMEFDGHTLENLVQESVNSSGTDIKEHIEIDDKNLMQKEQITEAVNTYEGGVDLKEHIQVSDECENLHENISEDLDMDRQTHNQSSESPENLNRELDSQELNQADDKLENLAQEDLQSHELTHASDENLEDDYLKNNLICDDSDTQFKECNDLDDSEILTFKNRNDLELEQDLEFSVQSEYQATKNDKVLEENQLIEGNVETLSEEIIGCEVVIENVQPDDNVLEVNELEVNTFCETRKEHNHQPQKMCNVQESTDSKLNSEEVFDKKQNSLVIEELKTTKQHVDTLAMDFTNKVNVIQNVSEAKLDELSKIGTVITPTSPEKTKISAQNSHKQDLEILEIPQTSKTNKDKEALLHLASLAAVQEKIPVQTPHDFISAQQNTALVPKNNIFANQLLDVSTIQQSEDSNDSEGNLLIDEEHVINDIVVASVTDNETAVQLSIPDTCDLGNDSLSILKAVESFEKPPTVKRGRGRPRKNKNQALDLSIKKKQAKPRTIKPKSNFSIDNILHGTTTVVQAPKIDLTSNINQNFKQLVSEGLKKSPRKSRKPVKLCIEPVTPPTEILPQQPTSMFKNVDFIRSCFKLSNDENDASFTIRDVTITKTPTSKQVENKQTKETMLAESLSTSLGLSKDVSITEIENQNYSHVGLNKEQEAIISKKGDLTIHIEDVSSATNMTVKEDNKETRNIQCDKLLAKSVTLDTSNNYPISESGEKCLEKEPVELSQDKNLQTTSAEQSSSKIEIVIEEIEVVDALSQNKENVKAVEACENPECVKEADKIYGNQDNVTDEISQNNVYVDTDQDKKKQLRTKGALKCFEIRALYVNIHRLNIDEQLQELKKSKSKERSTSLEDSKKIEEMCKNLEDNLPNDSIKLNIDTKISLDDSPLVKRRNRCSRRGKQSTDMNSSGDKIKENSEELSKDVEQEVIKSTVKIDDSETQKKKRKDLRTPITDHVSHKHTGTEKSVDMLKDIRTPITDHLPHKDPGTEKSVDMLKDLRTPITDHVPHKDPGTEKSVDMHKDLGTEKTDNTPAVKIQKEIHEDPGTEKNSDIPSVELPTKKHKDLETQNTDDIPLVELQKTKNKDLEPQKTDDMELEELQKTKNNDLRTQKTDDILPVELQKKKHKELGDHVELSELLPDEQVEISSNNQVIIDKILFEEISEQQINMSLDNSDKPKRSYATRSRSGSLDNSVVDVNMIDNTKEVVTVKQILSEIDKNVEVNVVLNDDKSLSQSIQNFTDGKNTLTTEVGDTEKLEENSKSRKRKKSLNRQLKSTDVQKKFEDDNKCSPNAEKSNSTKPQTELNHKRRYNTRSKSVSIETVVAETPKQRQTSNRKPTNVKNEIYSDTSHSDTSEKMGIPKESQSKTEKTLRENSNLNEESLIDDTLKLSDTKTKHVKSSEVINDIDVKFSKLRCDADKPISTKQTLSKPVVEIKDTNIKISKVEDKMDRLENGKKSSPSHITEGGIEHISENLQYDLKLNQNKTDTHLEIRNTENKVMEKAKKNRQSLSKVKDDKNCLNLVAKSDKDLAVEKNLTPEDEQYPVSVDSSKTENLKKPYATRSRGASQSLDNGNITNVSIEQKQPGTPKEKFKREYKAQQSLLNENTNVVNSGTLPPKLRRKSTTLEMKFDEKSDSPAKSLDTMSNLSILHGNLISNTELLSKCKNTVESTAEKLKKKLESDLKCEISSEVLLSMEHFYTDTSDDEVIPRRSIFAIPDVNKNKSKSVSSENSDTIIKVSKNFEDEDNIPLVKIKKMIESKQKTGNKNIQKNKSKRKQYKNKIDETNDMSENKDSNLPLKELEQSNSETKVNLLNKLNNKADTLYPNTSIDMGSIPKMQEVDKVQHNKPKRSGKSPKQTFGSRLTLRNTPKVIENSGSKSLRCQLDISSFPVEIQFALISKSTAIDKPKRQRRSRTILDKESVSSKKSSHGMENVNNVKENIKSTLDTDGNCQKLESDTVNMEEKIFKLDESDSVVKNILVGQKDTLLNFVAEVSNSDELNQNIEEACPNSKTTETSGNMPSDMIEDAVLKSKHSLEKCVGGNSDEVAVQNVDITVGKEETSEHYVEQVHTLEEEIVYDHVHIDQEEYFTENIIEDGCVTEEILENVDITLQTTDFVEEPSGVDVSFKATHNELIVNEDVVINTDLEIEQNKTENIETAIKDQQEPIENEVNEEEIRSDNISEPCNISGENEHFDVSEAQCIEDNIKNAEIKGFDVNPPEETTSENINSIVDTGENVNESTAGMENPKRNIENLELEMESQPNESDTTEVDNTDETAHSEPLKETLEDSLQINGQSFVENSMKYMTLENSKSTTLALDKVCNSQDKIETICEDTVVISHSMCNTHDTSEDMDTNNQETEVICSENYEKTELTEVKTHETINNDKLGDRCTDLSEESMDVKMSELDQNQEALDKGSIGETQNKIENYDTTEISENIFTDMIQEISNPSLKKSEEINAEVKVCLDKEQLCPETNTSEITDNIHTVEEVVPVSKSSMVESLESTAEFEVQNYDEVDQNREEVCTNTKTADVIEETIVMTSASLEESVGSNAELKDHNMDDEVVCSITETSELSENRPKEIEGTVMSNPLEQSVMSIPEIEGHNLNKEALFSKTETFEIPEKEPTDMIEQTVFMFKCLKESVGSNVETQACSLDEEPCPKTSENRLTDVIVETVANSLKSNAKVEGYNLDAETVWPKTETSEISENKPTNILKEAKEMPSALKEYVGNNTEVEVHNLDAETVLPKTETYEISKNKPTYILEEETKEMHSPSLEESVGSSTEVEGHNLDAETVWPKTETYEISENKLTYKLEEAKEMPSPSLEESVGSNTEVEGHNLDAETVWPKTETYEISENKPTYKLEEAKEMPSPSLEESVGSNNEVEGHNLDEEVGCPKINTTEISENRPTDMIEETVVISNPSLEEPARSNIKVLGDNLDEEMVYTKNNTTEMSESRHTDTIEETVVMTSHYLEESARNNSEVKGPSLNEEVVYATEMSESTIEETVGMTSHYLEESARNIVEIERHDLEEEVLYPKSNTTEITLEESARKNVEVEGHNLDEEVVYPKCITTDMSESRSTDMTEEIVVMRSPCLGEYTKSNTIEISEHRPTDMIEETVVMTSPSLEESARINVEVVDHNLGEEVVCPKNNTTEISESRQADMIENTEVMTSLEESTRSIVEDHNLNKELVYSKSNTTEISENISTDISEGTAVITSPPLEESPSKVEVKGKNMDEEEVYPKTNTTQISENRPLNIIEETIVTSPLKEAVWPTTKSYEISENKPTDMLKNESVQSNCNSELRSKNVDDYIKIKSFYPNIEATNLIEEIDMSNKESVQSILDVEVQKLEKCNKAEAVCPNSQTTAISENKSVQNNYETEMKNMEQLRSSEDPSISENTPDVIKKKTVEGTSSSFECSIANNSESNIKNLDEWTQKLQPEFNINTTEETVATEVGIYNHSVQNTDNICPDTNIKSDHEFCENTNSDLIKTVENASLEESIDSPESEYKNSDKINKNNEEFCPINITNDTPSMFKTVDLINHAVQMANMETINKNEKEISLDFSLEKSTLMSNFVKPSNSELAAKILDESDNITETTSITDNIYVGLSETICISNSSLEKSELEVKELPRVYLDESVQSNVESTVKEIVKNSESPYPSDQYTNKEIYPTEENLLISDKSYLQTNTECPKDNIKTMVNTGLDVIEGNDKNSEKTVDHQTEEIEINPVCEETNKVATLEENTNLYESNNTMSAVMSSILNQDHTLSNMSKEDIEKTEEQVTNYTSTTTSQATSTNYSIEEHLIVNPTIDSTKQELKNVVENPLDESIIPMHLIPEIAGTGSSQYFDTFDSLNQTSLEVDTSVNQAPETVTIENLPYNVTIPDISTKDDTVLFGSIMENKGISGTTDNINVNFDYKANLLVAKEPKLNEHQSNFIVNIDKKEEKANTRRRSIDADKKIQAAFDMFLQPKKEDTKVKQSNKRKQINFEDDSTDIKKTKLDKNSDFTNTNVSQSTNTPQLDFTSINVDVNLLKKKLSLKINDPMSSADANSKNIPCNLKKSKLVENSQVLYQSFTDYEQLPSTSFAQNMDTIKNDMEIPKMLITPRVDSSSVATCDVIGAQSNSDSSTLLLTSPCATSLETIRLLNSFVTSQADIPASDSLLVQNSESPVKCQNRVADDLESGIDGFSTSNSSFKYIFRSGDHNYTTMTDLGGPLVGGGIRTESKNILTGASTNFDKEENFDIKEQNLPDDWSELALEGIEIIGDEFVHNPSEKLNLDNAYAINALSTLVMLKSQTSEDSSTVFPLTKYNLEDIESMNLIECGSNIADESSNSNQGSVNKDDIHDIGQINPPTTWSQLISNENSGQQKVLVVPVEQCITPDFIINPKDLEELQMAMEESQFDQNASHYVTNLTVVSEPNKDVKTTDTLFSIITKPASSTTKATTSTTKATTNTTTVTSSTTKTTSNTSTATKVDEVKGKNETSVKNPRVFPKKISPAQSRAPEKVIEAFPPPRSHVKTIVSAPKKPIKEPPVPVTVATTPNSVVPLTVTTVKSPNSAVSTSKMTPSSSPKQTPDVSKVTSSNRVEKTQVTNQKSPVNQSKEQIILETIPLMLPKKSSSSKPVLSPSCTSDLLNLPTIYDMLKLRTRSSALKSGYASVNRYSPTPVKTDSEIFKADSNNIKDDSKSDIKNDRFDNKNVKTESKSLKIDNSPVKNDYSIDAILHNSTTPKRQISDKDDVSNPVKKARPSNQDELFDELKKEGNKNKVFKPEFYDLPKSDKITSRDLEKIKRSTSRNSCSSKDASPVSTSSRTSGESGGRKRGSSRGKDEHIGDRGTKRRLEISEGDDRRNGGKRQSTHTSSSSRSSSYNTHNVSNKTPSQSDGTTYGSKTDYNSVYQRRSSGSSQYYSNPTYQRNSNKPQHNYPKAYDTPNTTPYKQTPSQASSHQYSNSKDKTRKNYQKPRENYPKNHENYPKTHSKMQESSYTPTTGSFDPLRCDKKSNHPQSFGQQSSRPSRSTDPRDLKGHSAHGKDSKEQRQGSYGYDPNKPYNRPSRSTDPRQPSFSSYQNFFRDGPSFPNAGNDGTDWITKLEGSVDPNLLLTNTPKF